MADIRSLLKNERAARRITHPHATYSTTGTLVCLVCHIQLKSESLWNNHLRSAQHAMRLQRIRDGALGRPPGAPAPAVESAPLEDGDVAEDDTKNHAESNGTSHQPAMLQSKKRKASDDEDYVTKRNKRESSLEDILDEEIPKKADLSTNSATNALLAEVQLPSRPATPMKVVQNLTPTKPPTPAVDEDEWAAFEADIAATEAPQAEDAVITAPAMTAEQIAAKSREEESAQKKERMEAEMEGDKEDATRKLEDEFEQMGELEERVRKLKEKREALRLNGNSTADNNASNDGIAVGFAGPVAQQPGGEDEEDDDDDDDEEGDEDDWDAFRLKR